MTFSRTNRHTHTHTHTHTQTYLKSNRKMINWSAYLFLVAIRYIHLNSAIS